MSVCVYVRPPLLEGKKKIAMKKKESHNLSHCHSHNNEGNKNQDNENGDNVNKDNNNKDNHNEDNNNEDNNNKDNY